MANELQSAYLGYLMTVNDEPIVINPEGIYELQGDDLSITSLTFPVDTTITLQYKASMSQVQDKTQLARTIDYTRKVGQLWGVFNYEDSIFQKLWNKYYEKYSTYTQYLLVIDGLKIEAEPGTVFYLSESGETGFERFVIGDTCTLSFDDENTIITGLYFSGIHLDEATAAEQDRDILPDNKFIDTGITIRRIKDVVNPIEHGVYTLDTSDNDTSVLLSKLIKATDNEIYNSLLTKVSDIEYAEALVANLSQNRIIWHNNNWWLFTDTNDVLCPVEALVDYSFELYKGWYYTE